MNEFINPETVSENEIMESPLNVLFEAVSGADITDLDIEEEKVVKDVLEDVSECSDIVVVGADDDTAETVNESEDNEKTVIYIVKTNTTPDNDTVSYDAVFRLDDNQYEFLIDTINNRPTETTEEIPIIVNVSDNSAYYEKIIENQNGITGLNIILIGMAFGYFVKETIFRGI